MSDQKVFVDIDTPVKDDDVHDQKRTHDIYQLFDNYVKSNVSEISACESEFEMSDYECDEFVFATKNDRDKKRRSTMAFALNDPDMRRKSSAEISKILKQFYSKAEEGESSDVEVPYNFASMPLDEMIDTYLSVNKEASELESAYSSRATAAAENDLTTLISWLEEKKKTVTFDLPQAKNAEITADGTAYQTNSQAISTTVNCIRTKMSRIQEKLDALKLLNSIPN